MTTAAAKIDSWVLLRGLGREQGHWGEFLTRLQGALPQKNFYCLDLPGSGELFQAPSPSSVAAIRSDLQGQQQASAIAAPFGIIGLSLGGMLALDWMAASDAVAAVVVINTSANDFPLHWRFRPSSIGLGVRAICSSDVEQQERRVLQMTSSKHADNPETLRRWADIQRQRPVARATLARQLLAASRFALPDNCHATPGLVLASDSDGIVSPRCSEGIARRYGWALQSNRGAGHDIPLDDPEWVVDRFCDWLGIGHRAP